VKFPEGYTLEFGGQFENLREAKARLAIVVPTALIFIFGAYLHGLRQRPGKRCSFTRGFHSP
jgi:Cu/Ag efflux pump CusA